MKSSEQILEYLAEEIGRIYFRPLMYGGSAAGVDLLLSNYHELWVFITEQVEEYNMLCKINYKRENCGSAGFATAHRIENPHLEEHEIAFYVVDQWEKISKSMDIPVPYEKIKSILADLLKSGNTNHMLNEKLFHNQEHAPGLKPAQ